MFRKYRGLFVAVSSAGLLFATPTQSYAIFHWFSRACGCGAEPATYAAPVVEAAPVVAPTVVNYLPQTCYRTQYVTVPVTTYRPYITRDVCTGCPVTAMRPTVAYVQQARMVPYTTYRAVVTSGPVMGTSYAPVYAAPSSTCSSCSAAPAVAAPMAAAPAVAVPMATSPAAPPGYYNGAPAAAANGTGVPTLAPGMTPGVSTFQRPTMAVPPNGVPSELRQKPIAVPGPESGGEAATKNGGSSSGNSPKASEPKSGSHADPTSAAPRLINPDDRTTQQLSAPVRYAVHRITPAMPASSNITPVVWRDAAARALTESAPEQPAAQPAPASDADGWRPSKR